MLLTTFECHYNVVQKLTEAEYKSGFQIINYTPYVNVLGEL